MPSPAPLESLLPSVRLEDTSLFLDFDGTLVELADQPDAVSIDDLLPPLLDRLRDHLDGRLAIVSGRSVAQLDNMLGALATRLNLVGSHGSEIRVSGERIVGPERPRALHLAENVFSDAFAGEAGVIVEVKTLGVAVHYRLAPSAGPRANALAQSWGAQTGLVVQKGNMMVELRTAGADKGRGIADLMKAAPFGGHQPVFLGDDETDEPGFAWCQGAGGFGVLVGAPRPTRARYHLQNVPAVHSWLASL